MNPESYHYQPESYNNLLFSLTREDSLEIETRNIEQAAQALAAGEVVVMQLYTVGLLVDGTNEEALKKLFSAKQIPYERALRGERPIVSILPLPEYRGDIIDIHKHHPDIQEVFQDNQRMLTPDGHALFYRVHVPPGKEYLKIPLITVDEKTGERSIVLLWHDNPYISLLEERTRAYKGGKPLLLTGSSANITGHPQPAQLENLDKDILPFVTTTVDLRDERILSIIEEQRNAIPIINLIAHPPTVLRSSKMYDAIPEHPKLQKLIENNNPQKAA